MPAAPLEALPAPRFREVYRLCPICGAEDVEYEFVVEGVAFSRCRACTLLFANPAPRPAERAPIAGIDEIYPALRSFAVRALGRQPESVLVVRTAAGVRDAAAIEVAPDELPTSERFDLVVAIGSIESASDPIEHARRLRRCVSDRGVLLLATPSVASSDAQAQLLSWSTFRSKTPWYFDAETVQLTLTRAAFGRFMPVIEARDCVPEPSSALQRFFASHVALVAAPVIPAPSPRLSVIVPVFNEAGTVAELLDRVLAKVIEGVDIEVVIVESNSTDGSREIVSRYADHRRVRLVLEEGPRGKGHAVRTGLRHATGDVILFQDADLEYDVNDYDQLVEPLFALRRNFVLGSRHGSRGNSWKIRRFEKRPLVSAVMNLAHLGLLVMFNHLYRQSLSDPFTMYKVFRRDCLAGLTFECNRFDFDYEISIKLIRKGYRPLEIPVNYLSRSFAEGKKVAFFRDPPTWIKAMLRLRRVELYSFAEGSR